MRLTTRSFSPELMEAPDVDPCDLAGAFRELEVVNRLLGGYSTSLAGVKRLVRRSEPLSLLDVGCGTGDTLRHLADWARREGIQSDFLGVDVNRFTCDLAREQCCSYPEIEIRHADLFEMSANPRYGIVHCALMLHHVNGHENTRNALRKMGCMASRGVVVNDLHRHPVAYASISLLTRILSRNRLILHDAPQSVARAFHRDELLRGCREAGLRVISMRWHWAFRWLVVGETQ